MADEIIKIAAPPSDMGEQSRDLEEEKNRNAKLMLEIQRHKMKNVKRNGFEKPFHWLQITTWILFGL